MKSTDTNQTETAATAVAPSAIADTDTAPPAITSMALTDTDAAFEQVEKLKRTSEFKHNLFVLESLVSRDFKLKYRRSVLGVLWSILNPLLMMIVLAAVFSFVFRFSIENFPLYLIIGNILFDFMNRATSGSVTSIIDAQSLIKKIRINKMIFPLERVTFELVNFAISLIAVVIVMAYYQVWPSLHAIWGLPFVVICVTVFSMGLSLLLSALAVFFRDVVHLWSVVMTAWTYATPLFYPYDILAPWMQSVMQFNPMFHYVQFFRSVMMWNTNPGALECLICVSMALITFGVGALVFSKNQRKFILHI